MRQSSFVECDDFFVNAQFKREYELESEEVDLEHLDDLKPYENQKGFLDAQKFYTTERLCFPEQAYDWSQQNDYDVNKPSPQWLLGREEQFFQMAYEQECRQVSQPQIQDLNSEFIQSHCKEGTDCNSDCEHLRYDEQSQFVIDKWEKKQKRLGPENKTKSKYQKEKGQIEKKKPNKIDKKNPENSVTKYFGTNTIRLFSDHYNDGEKSRDYTDVQKYKKYFRCDSRRRKLKDYLWGKHYIIDLMSSLKLKNRRHNIRYVNNLLSVAFDLRNSWKNTPGDVKVHIDSKWESSII